VKNLSFDLLRTGSRKHLLLPVSRLVNMGFSGRDKEEVYKHIEELRKEGIQSPTTIPSVYPVSPYMLTQEPIIYVQDEKTSGEAEFVLVINDKNIYVAVGSDHTDRELEKTSILKSKQICPNVVSKEAWLIDDISSGWDDIILRSWAILGAERTLYQEAPLGSLLKPDSLVEFVTSRVVDGSISEMTIYSGTVAILTNQMIYADIFEVELFDPQSGNKLVCKYEIRLMDFLYQPQ
jgi:hypothetical protein